MEIDFVSRKLEKTMNSAELLKKAYGQQARTIMVRLAVLRSAPTLANVPMEKPERCHELKYDRKGCFAVDLKHPYRLVFEPAEDSVPRLENGAIDRGKVRSIRVLEVVDYH